MIGIEQLAQKLHIDDSRWYLRACARCWRTFGLVKKSDGSPVIMCCTQCWPTEHLRL